MELCRKVVFLAQCVRVFDADCMAAYREKAEGSELQLNPSYKNIFVFEY